MRIGIIALLQESNTFIGQPTTFTHFQQELLVTGDAVRERLGETHHEVGGMFHALAEAGEEAVPLFAARAMPFGVIDAIPAIKQPRGGRRRRPDKVLGDKAYDAEAKIRQALRDRGIEPLIAKRNTEHGSGLGKHRCVIEGVFAWLFKQRRLRVRYEKRDDIHTAFLILGCLLICWNRVQGFC